MSALSDLVNKNKKPTQSSGSALATLAKGPIQSNRPAGFVGPIFHSLPKNEVAAFRAATLPPWLGGGVYNIDRLNPSNLIKTPRAYAGVPTSAGSERDHIIPVSLGGVSDNKGNIRVVPEKDNPAKLEAEIAAKVARGEMTLAQGRLAIISFKQQQQQSLKTTVKGNFLKALGDIIEAPLKKTAEKTVEFLQGPAERVEAIGQSIKQKSFTPLKESFAAQEKELVIQPGDDKETQIKKATNIALMLGVDTGLSAKKPKTSSSGIQPKPLPEGKLPAATPKIESLGGQGSQQLRPEPLKPVQAKLTESPKPQINSQKILSKPVSSGHSLSQDFYNVNRLNIKPEAKVGITREIENAKQQIQEVIGGKLSNKEVIDRANVTARTLRKTVTQEETADKIALNLNLRRKIAKVAEDGKIDADFVDLWIKDKAAGADVARQLQARKIIADPQEASAIDLLLEGIYKQNKNADEIIAAAKNVDFNDPKQVTEFYRQFVKPKTSEWIDLLRYNSMLSSPTTHIVNSVSNFQGTGLIAPVEKTITGALDATRAALTGSQRKYFMGEGVEYAKGYYSNVKQASQTFWNVMRGRELNKNPDVRNIPLATKGGKAVVEKTLSVPLRLLEAADRFFTTLTEGGVTKSLQYKIAKGGKTGNLDKVARAEAQKRLFRSEGNLPEQGQVLNAIDTVTNTLMKLRSSDNPIVATISKFTLPFVRTPMNLFKQGIEYSPLGVITLPGAANKTEQLSKIIIGMTSASAAATLLGSNRLTWAEPTEAKAKAEFRASGKQPYAVKIGNNWISYSKLHPAFAFNFALISALDNGIKNKKVDESQAHAILSSFAKYGQFVADQSYMKNIGDFVATTKGDLEGPSRYLANYPQQLVPFRSLLGWVNRIIDPVQRQADPKSKMLDKQMQLFMAQIPGLSQKVPVRLGPDGKPIPNQNRLLNSVSPFRVTTERKIEPTIKPVPKGKEKKPKTFKY